MVKARELVAMDPEELATRLAESRRELLNLRFQLATGQLDNTARLRLVRRDVARMLCVMREREIDEVEGLYELAPSASTVPVRSGGERGGATSAEDEPEEDELTDELGEDDLEEDELTDELGEDDEEEEA